MSRLLIFLSFGIICGSTTLSAQSGLTASHSASSFSIEPDGASTLGTVSLQSGADIRFGSSAPNYSIGEGHDILLGRSLGPDEAKLRVALKAPATLDASELAGAWQLYLFEVDENFGNEFSTGSETFVAQANTFTIDGDRRATGDLGEPVTFAVNAAKDLMVSTSSATGIHSLLILVRVESGGTTAQMAGTWTVGSFAADFSASQPEIWYDGDTLTAAANGALALDGESSTWAANGTGSLTFSDPEGSTTLSVSQSRNVLAYTSTLGDSPDQAFEGALVLRHATAPSVAALAGDWTLLTYEIKTTSGDPNNPNNGGDPSDSETIESFHPDGTTLASREHYTDGQLDGQPAREIWDTNGNLTLVEDYTDGALTLRIETQYIVDLPTRYTETTYDGNNATSALIVAYHADGETVSSRSSSNTTANGDLSILDAYSEDGSQTSHSRFLDGLLDGLQQNWSGGKLDSEALYDRGTLRASTTWNYHPNGEASAKQTTSYTSGGFTQETHLWHDDGSRSQIERTRNGLQHGIQQGFDSAGNLIQEEDYINGIPHGLFKAWYVGGAQQQSASGYNNGKLHGTYSIWYPDGQIKETATYSNGILSGAYSAWYEAGQIKETQDYKDGLKHGEGYIYQNDLSEGWRDKAHYLYEYGELRHTEVWSYDANEVLRSHTFESSDAGDLADGAPADEGLAEAYDEEGRPTSYFESKNGAFDGIHRTWKDGVMRSEYYYSQGLQHGRSRRWNPDTGELEFDAYYENGLLHGPYKSYRNGILYLSVEYIDDLREGVFTTYETYGTNTATYRNDILHGPYSNLGSTGARTSGTYENGLKEGPWLRYDLDVLTQVTEYSQGSKHGIEETYAISDETHYLSIRSHFTNGLQDGVFERLRTDGSVFALSLYDSGIEIGPRYRFHSNGQTNFEYHFLGGLINGTSISYHANGVISSTTVYQAGVINGAMRNYDEEGRITLSAYRHMGENCGTWTSTTYDSNGIAKSFQTEYPPCPPESDLPITRGLKGVVTANGVGVANVRIDLGAGVATDSHSDGFYLLELGDSTSTTLTLTHPGYPDKIQVISLPAEYTYDTLNIDLNGFSDPALALGEPSVGGDHFLKDISLPVSLEVTLSGGSDNQSDIIWNRPDGKEKKIAESSFFFDPGFDLDQSGNVGSIFSRSSKGVESEPIPLPSYQQSENPQWAQELGRWKAAAPANRGEIGEYYLAAKWPPTPINIGLRKSEVPTDVWVLWSAVPGVGGEDLGLFDLQLVIEALAKTDGTGNAKLKGGGHLRIGPVEARLNADGKGELDWDNKLKFKKISLLVEGDLVYEDGVSLLKLLPGGQLPIISKLLEIELQTGIGLGNYIALEVINGQISIQATDIRINIPWGGQLVSTLVKDENFELFMKGKMVLVIGVEGNSTHFKDLESTIEGKLKLRVTDFIDKEWSFTIPEKPSPNSSRSINNAPYLVNPDFIQISPYSRFHPQDLVQIFSSKTVPFEESSDPPIVSNIYPYAEPSIAQNGNAKALAYVHFDPNHPVGQSTRLYYSIDSGNGFQAPKPLHNQARSDFSPQLAYLPDGQLLAVWETSQLDQIATTLDERLSGLEIAWSLYDENSDTWSEPAQISNNSQLDHNPTIANSPSGPMILWHSNAANAYIAENATPDSLHFATWNGSSFDIPIQLGYDIPALGKTSLAYDGNSAVVSWIQDIDGDFDTPNDTELFWSKFDGTSWSDALRITNDTLPDTNPNVFCLQYGDFESIWIKDNQLVRLANTTTYSYETVLPSTDDERMPNYSVTCNANGDTALVWTKYQNERHDLYYSLYDSQNAQWSDALNLTEDVQQERFPAFTIDDQSSVTVVYLSEDPETEQRDLHVLTREAGIDLTIDSISIAASENSENQYALEATVQNNGSRNANNALVTFHLGDPDNGGTLLGQTSLNLLGGQSQEVSIDTSGLAPDTTGTIYARIYPDNTITELDETNNTATSDLHPADLAASYFTWDRDVSDETTVTLVGTITNNGATAQMDIPVQISDESGVLYTTSIATLDPGESQDITTTLTNLSESEYRFTLTLDPEQTLAEPDRGDNAFPLYLVLRQLKDSDGDGMENAWEELHFGTLERDGRGDFDADGLSDAFEFITQNDPLDPKSKFPFTIEPHPADPSKVLIRFPSLQGRIYRIQRSSDFSNWTNDSFHLGTGQTISVAMDPANGVRVQIGLQ